MKRILTVMPPVIISILITLMGIWSPSVMKTVSLRTDAYDSDHDTQKKKRAFGNRQGLSYIRRWQPVFSGCCLFTRKCCGALSLWDVMLSCSVLRHSRHCLGTDILLNILQKRPLRRRSARQTSGKINRNMAGRGLRCSQQRRLVSMVPLIASMPSGLFTGLIFQMALPLTFIGTGLPLNMWYPAYYQRKMGIVPAGTEEKRRPAGSETRKTGKSGEETMDVKYKVVAINGSPHRAAGNTSIMIGMISAVLAREGIDVEEIFVADKNIEYCIGCGVCLEKKKCWRQDDHESITGKLLAADGITRFSCLFYACNGTDEDLYRPLLSFGHKPRTT